MIPLSYGVSVFLVGVVLCLVALSLYVWYRPPVDRDWQPVRPASAPPAVWPDAGLPPRPVQRHRAGLGNGGGHHRSKAALVHVGATADWSPGDEVDQAGSSPDLLTLAELAEADHAALAPITEALERADGVVTDIILRLMRDNTSEEVHRAVVSALGTRELSAAEMHEALRDVGLTALLPVVEA